jgi:2'-5' RNA ligase
VSDSRPADESALLVAIPEAELVIGQLRLRHDPAAAKGVPAHVTILYPFAPASELTDDVRRAVADLFRSRPPFEYRFEHVARFDDGTVYLAPDTPESFRGLTDAAASRWPGFPPYGGVFDDVIPHLTVGHRLGNDADEVQEAAAEALRAQGPVTGRATEVVLMVAGSGGQWRIDSRHDLAGTA